MGTTPRRRRLLSRRFTDALAYAAELHADQQRKGPGDIPYIGHLLGVASLVLEHGGGEIEAIAALLHDALEDRPRDASTWHARKRRYVAHVADMFDDAALVSLADKLHNARKIVLDLREQGASVWDRFKADKDARQVLAEELERTVRKMHMLGAFADDGC